ncbi:MAG: NERD domain-containing protein [Anaeroplasmataceae bacterium]|nr:NERD domain-containing protein [Anaeroplasmataceae bacterium]
MLGLVQKNRGGTFTSDLNKITRRYIKKEGYFRAFNYSGKIDFILITPWRILCITGNKFAGKCIGNLEAVNWIIGNKTIPNPILSNEENIKFLKSILGEDAPIENVVLFMGHIDLSEMKNYKEIFTIKKFLNYIEKTNDGLQIDSKEYYQMLIDNR